MTAKLVFEGLEARLVADQNYAGGAVWALERRSKDILGATTWIEIDINDSTLVLCKLVQEAARKIPAPEKEAKEA